MAFCRKSWRWVRHISPLTLLTLTQTTLTTLTVLPKMEVELCLMLMWMPMRMGSQAMHHTVSYGNWKTPE